ncbi:flagellar hook-length control protein FliK [Nitrobacter sp.]|uniref:flagellar hook-length control protein FliK n=2 Tax=Nitrobacter sp. TaxID=29420 RepID=UPI001D9D5631|nr:flagellar hook-length control protein FliK [Nitrobacter sp.]MCB1391731.1 flagellar hook-length control protein FliK [Nitrobacter sp.]MCV0384856.1 flagellar hook-length control protein FliK [Nitrobacter sp.]
MVSVTTEAAANVSFQSAQPSSQRSGRSSEDTFETLVDAGAQGSHATVARSRNSRDQFNRRLNVPRQGHVTQEPADNSRTSSARPPQASSEEADRNMRESASGAEASSAARRHRAKHDDSEIASTGDASDSLEASSDMTAPGVSPDPVATPPATVVPVTTPIAGAAAGSATEPVLSAAELTLSQQTGAMTASSANGDSNPALATDTAAAAETVLQQTPDTGQAVRTVMQTGGALAAAVATAAPGEAKTTVKTLDKAPSGKTTASITPEIQPGPEAPVLTTPSAAGGNPISSHDAAPKHDAAESANNAPTDAGASSTQTTPAPPHPARAPDAAAAPQPGPADSGQSINSAFTQPQVQSAAATTPVTPQYNVAVVAGAAVPLNGLAVQIAVTALSGKSRFEIRLDPADLGRIDVRLDVDRQGRVTSHLTVEKPETLAMLRQDAPQLQRALQDAGLKTGDSGLQFSLRDQSSQEQNARDGNGRHNQRLIVTEENVPIAAAGRDYGRILGSNRGLDIRV